MVEETFGDLPEKVVSLALRLGEEAQAKGLKVATAESCTAGGIAFAITSAPGSSAWFEAGFVTYSNAMKVRLLGVSPLTLREHGAVSLETAGEMAQGALRVSGADIAVAVSGIAGPGGGSEDKPVGTVAFGFALAGGDCMTTMERFTGGRQAVRTASICHALERLIYLTGAIARKV